MDELSNFHFTLRRLIQQGNQLMLKYPGKQSLLLNNIITKLTQADAEVETLLKVHLHEQK